jgi:hypothetical protein
MFKPLPPYEVWLAVSEHPGRDPENFEDGIMSWGRRIDYRARTRTTSLLQFAYKLAQPRSNMFLSSQSVWIVSHSNLNGFAWDRTLNSSFLEAHFMVATLAQDMKFGEIKFSPTRPLARDFMRQKMNISWHLNTHNGLIC